MKKFLLGTVALIAFAAPAAAADLAARPYQGPAGADRRRVRLERLLHRRQWRLGFEPQVLGLRSRRRGVLRRLLRVAMTRPAARSVVRSVIAGRPAAGCSASKPRATGRTSRAAMSACLIPRFAIASNIDAFGLFTGQIGYAANNVLFYVKGGAAVTSDRYRIVDVPAPAFWLPTPATTPAGVPSSAPASNSASLRTGRPASNTTTCSCRTATTPSSRRPASPSAPIASARTSISSPFASTIAGVARSSRSTDLRFQQTDYRKGRPRAGLFVWLYRGIARTRYGCILPTFAADVVFRRQHSAMTSRYMDPQPQIDG